MSKSDKDIAKKMKMDISSATKEEKKTSKLFKQKQKTYESLTKKKSTENYDITLAKNELTEATDQHKNACNTLVSAKVILLEHIHKYDDKFQFPQQIISPIPSTFPIGSRNANTFWTPDEDF